MLDAAKAFDQIIRGCPERLFGAGFRWSSFVREATEVKLRPSARKAPAAREVEPIRAHKLLKAVKVSVTPSAGSNERL